MEIKSCTLKWIWYFFVSSFSHCGNNLYSAELVISWSNGNWRSCRQWLYQEGLSVGIHLAFCIWYLFHAVLPNGMQIFINSCWYIFSFVQASIFCHGWIIDGMVIRSFLKLFSCFYPPLGTYQWQLVTIQLTFEIEVVYLGHLLALF